MNGIYASDIERDKAIHDIDNNVKIILSSLEHMNKCISDHETRLRVVEKTQAQHIVWLQLFGGIAIGSILTGVLSSLFR